MPLEVRQQVPKGAAHLSEAFPFQERLDGIRMHQRVWLGERRKVRFLRHSKPEGYAAAGRLSFSAECRLDGCNELPSNAQGSVAAEGDGIFVAKLHDGVPEPDHAYLGEVFEVRTEPCEGPSLGLNKPTVLTEEMVHRRPLAVLGSLDGLVFMKGQQGGFRHA